MAYFREGCLLCGEPLIYYTEAKALSCAFCGAVCHANAACEEGHYICDACHSAKGIAEIKAYLLKTNSTNPIAMAQELMKSPLIHIHGPEHHFLVPAVLITAYWNALEEKSFDLAEALEEGAQRAREVPGGICGLWGGCGAGIGAGIFMSIVTGATPLSRESWQWANETTAQCLLDIAGQGGPRCCKRDSFLAILKAAEITEEKLEVALDLPDQVLCSFFHINKECIQEACPYYPVKAKMQTGGPLEG